MVIFECINFTEGKTGIAIWKCNLCGSRFQTGCKENTKLGDKREGRCIHCRRS